MMSFIVFAAGLFNRRICYPLVIATLCACFYFSVALLARVMQQGSPIHYYLGAWDPPWGIEYVVDHLNGLILVSVALIALLVGIYSRSIAAGEFREEKLPQFYTLFLLQVTGLLGMTITGDAFNLYVLLEIASFSAYAIIGMGEGAAAFAAFRYMIFGTIGACAYLLGVGYLYILTGSLNMADLRDLLPPLYGSRVLMAGFAFLMVGVAIKMGLFPVHTWLPDSYTLAPSSVSALLAPLFTKVGAYVLLRVLFTIFDPTFSVTVIPATAVLGWLGVAGVLFAGVMALAQTDLKRMLCYLIVAEMGYIVIGIASANRFGLTGAVLHTVNDMFMMACLFTAVGTINACAGTRNLRDLRGINRRLPVTMGVFVVAALSVIGIPPLCGFFSKWYLVLGAIKAGQWAYVAALLISSLLSAVLFFRVIEQVYFAGHETGDGSKTVIDRIPLSQLAPMVCLALCILLLGVFSGKLINTVIAFALPAAL
jgi:multicomponent Na+:H+ antiporter subunit D